MAFLLLVPRSDRNGISVNNVMKIAVLRVARGVVPAATSLSSVTREGSLDSSSSTALIVSSRMLREEVMKECKNERGVTRVQMGARTGVATRTSARTPVRTRVII